MKNPLIIAIVAAMAWGTWPGLMKITPIPPGIMMSGISFMTWVTTVLWFASQKALPFNEAMHNPKGMILILISGILNGVGIILYGILFAPNSGFDGSKYGALATGLIPFFILISCAIIAKETITLQRGLAIMGLCVSAYFLQKS